MTEPKATTIGELIDAGEAAEKAYRRASKAKDRASDRLWQIRGVQRQQPHTHITKLKARKTRMEVDLYLKQGQFELRIFRYGKLRAEQWMTVTETWTVDGDEDIPVDIDWYVGGVDYRNRRRLSARNHMILSRSEIRAAIEEARGRRLAIVEDEDEEEGLDDA